MRLNIFIKAFIFASILLTTVCASGVEYNLLKNSGFENSYKRWDAYGKMFKISHDSYSGKNAVEFGNSGVGYTTDLLPNIENIDGTSTYIFSGYYKNSPKTIETWVGVEYYNSDWDHIGEREFKLKKNIKYSKFEYKLLPPKGTNYMEVWVWSDTDKGGSTLVDELKLYPLKFTPAMCKLLQNGDFENELNGWSTYAQNASVIKEAQSGKKAFKIIDGGMDESIKVFNTRERTYQFSGYYKTNNKNVEAYVGIDFYSKEGKLILSKNLQLKDSSKYSKFTINATSKEPIDSIQVWSWIDSGKTKGELILDNLSLSPSECYDYVTPSSLPPHNIKVKDAPIFVVIGFDDNTMSTGIDWAINMLKKYNAKASFYLNTKGLDTYVEDEPSKLKQAMLNLKNSGFEIGNHTYDHQEGFTEKQIKAYSQQNWQVEISKCEDRLKNKIGVTQNDRYLQGFRSPYLLYNQNLLDVLKKRNYLYDCSIEEGYPSMYDGTNFRWPYQLNGGSPGHNEGWYGNPENPDHVTIKGAIGLWELPVYVMMIPKDSECEKYGIKKGLFKRIQKRMPYLSDYKITGFDYNFWELAKLSKAEFLGILKYNLDLRIKGNRAPFTFGAHTQYYMDNSSIVNPNVTTKEMREAIEEFIAYATKQPNVRVTTALDVIKWCQNPKPINNQGAKK